ncbi:GNAT family N-acetyltransferase [Gloeobacter kilaueensis]|uniref:Acetyltransferase n=1 Tax=Gloeobacter kilaueensis (strain ATCC BAA-2537 / CCAP 1431/1 / ULC 316 / JS1) TaxID=1183438 RepID=U5QPI9_GLOK1|nr:GNAT family N-acetyltransferase [Gloeobacter kilaueensis]AGY59529.1 acetyltransferase [Gloeobacter kilaueensis JS1]
MSGAITIQDNPDQAELDALYGQLRAYNAPYIGEATPERLAVVLKDDQGQLAGGVHASTALGWLDVYQLWVRADLRGQGYGKALMQAVEQAARERGCTQVLLDTFSFQAPGFYQKLGYQIVAVLEYGEHHRYLLKKNLNAV